jgi:hypothetical protein
MISSAVNVRDPLFVRGSTRKTRIAIVLSYLQQDKQLDHLADTCR